MYWQLSNKQKQWISQLISFEKSAISILDLLREDWPVGQLEISTFQQKLVVHLDEEESSQLEMIVKHVLDVCDLVRQLKDENLIHTWKDLPREDNTVWIGEKKDEAAPKFLPDLGVAMDMLHWAGQKIQIREGLVKLVKRDFKDQTLHNQLVNRRIMVSGFIILFITMLFFGVYLNRMNERKINDFQYEMIRIRDREKETLDSLNLDIKNLYRLNDQMARDSQPETELKIMGDVVDRSIDQLNERTSALEARIKESQKMLRSNDSLLRKLSVDKQY